MGSDFAACFQMDAVHVGLALAASQGYRRGVVALVFADRLSALGAKG
jgi:hypothetical protein